MSVKKIFFKGVKWTTIGKLAVSLLQLLQIAILTRFLTKSDFGLIAMALVVVNLSSVFVDMGFTTAILHIQGATKKQYSSIYWLNLFLSFLLYFLLFFSASFISEFYNEPELEVVIYILGLNIIFHAIGRQHRTILQKNFRFKNIFLIEILSSFISTLLALLLVVNGYGVYSLIYAVLLASLISNLLFFIANFKKDPILLFFRWAEVKPFFKIGSYTLGSSILDFFSREADVFIIGKFLGVEKLGVYSLVKQVVSKLFVIINPILSTVFSPILSSMQTEKNKLADYYLKMIRYLSYLSFPIYLSVILFSQGILNILYGETYVFSHFTLSFLAIAYCIISIGNITGSLQIATGRTDLGFKWTVIRILSQPLFVLLASFSGNLNVVSASIALYAIITIPFLYIIQIRRMVSISFKQYLSQFINPLFIFLLITSLYFLVNIFFSLDKSVFFPFMFLIVGILCFFILFWCLEKKGIKELILLLGIKNNTKLK